MLVVPLKFMCSTQCDTPVRPGRSSFDPTLYQHQTEASGAVCSSWTSTFNPLPSVVERISSFHHIVCADTETLHTETLHFAAHRGLRMVEWGTFVAGFVTVG